MRGQKTFIVFGSGYVKSIIGFVAFFFVSRLMGSEVLGIIGYHLSVLGLFSILLDLGLTSAHIKRVSEKADLGTCNGTFFTLKLIAFLVYSVFVVVYVLNTELGKAQMPMNGQSETNLVSVILFGYYIFDQFAAALTSTFSAREEFVKMNIPTILGGALKTVVAVTAAFLSWGVIGLAVAYLVDALFSFFFSIFLFARNRIPVKRPTWKMAQSYFRYALPMVVIIPISVLISNIDRVMIKQLSDTAQVGLYFAVQAIFEIFKQFSAAAMQVLLPKISADFAMNRFQELDDSIRKTSRYLIMIIVPFSFLLSAQADWVVVICFGKEFSAASNVLAVFGITAVVIAIARPYSNVLYGTENHQKLAWISILDLLVLAPCYFLMIPTGKSYWGFDSLGLGATGAALTNLVIWLISFGLQILLVRKATGIAFNWRIIKFVLMGLVAWGVVATCRHFLMDSLMLPLIINVAVCSAVGLLTYFIGLILIHEWRRDDWDYLLAQINMKSLMHNAVKEISEKKSPDS